MNGLDRERRRPGSLAPVLMVQGTSSSVGKSLLVTGLCRLFARHGLRVAPFKAQNMALNAHVTREGGEIGTAQAIQADAARVMATTDMNPVLLKPEAEKRCQVVLHGQVLGAMSAMDYHGIKPQLREEILASLQRLRFAYDLVVIEGAGSPAEVNLKENDLVNMFVARSVKAPVLLVGDIDRGGVFAALVGTLALLTEEEQGLVRGFVINKFRGDIELLKPGLVFLEERTRIPVTGVLPYLSRLRIGDEDSLALDDKPKRLALGSGKLNIAILRYPRISNYDEFNGLEHEESVHVAYVQDRNSLAEADLVILPGSKSVISDLLWLRSLKLDEALQQRVRDGKAIFAICGGYQLLAQKIHDPHLTEADIRSAEGLALAPFEVQFQKHKTTCRVRAFAQAFGKPEGRSEAIAVEGYEIHMGEVLPLAPHQSLARIVERGTEALALDEGYVSADGQIRGTLIHGLLQNEAYRQNLVDWLWKLKGSDARPAAEPSEVPEDDPYDRLAASLEEHLDIKAIYELLNAQIC